MTHPVHRDMAEQGLLALPVEERHGLIWLLAEGDPPLDVFQAEDLHVAELMQRGLKAGGTTSLVFGQLEYAVPWFHQSIEQALAE